MVVGICGGELVWGGLGSASPLISGTYCHGICAADDRSLFMALRGRGDSLGEGSGIFRHFNERSWYLLYGHHTSRFPGQLHNEARALSAMD